MCREHPRHRTVDEIVAKVWLIGRSYSAAIERRRDAKGTGDDFYEKEVGPQMQSQPIDSWLGMVQDNDIPGSPATIVVHKKLTDLFREITGLEKRSLASKYLHLHKPNAFFIYDSRARQSIVKLVPRIADIAELDADEFDPEYRDFVRRCTWLRDHIRQTLGVELTPREIDSRVLTIGDDVRPGSDG